MEVMEKIVQGIDIEDLRDKIFCERCIAARLSFEVALQYRGDMKASPATGDLICIHCYDNEIDDSDQGIKYKRRSRAEIEYVTKVIAEFEKFKKIRLNSPLVSLALQN